MKMTLMRKMDRIGYLRRVRPMLLIPPIYSAPPHIAVKSCAYTPSISVNTPSFQTKMAHILLLRYEDRQYMKCTASVIHVVFVRCGDTCGHHGINPKCGLSGLSHPQHIFQDGAPLWVLKFFGASSSVTICTTLFGLVWTSYFGSYSHKLSPIMWHGQHFLKMYIVGVARVKGLFNLFLLESLLQRLIHTCLGHTTLNSTDGLFMYGCAVQVLLTVQYTWTHTIWVLIM